MSPDDANIQVIHRISGLISIGELSDCNLNRLKIGVISINAMPASLPIGSIATLTLIHCVECSRSGRTFSNAICLRDPLDGPPVHWSVRSSFHRSFVRSFVRPFRVRPGVCLPAALYPIEIEQKEKGSGGEIFENEERNKGNKEAEKIGADATAAPLVPGTHPFSSWAVRRKIQIYAFALVAAGALQSSRFSNDDREGRQTKGI